MGIRSSHDGGAAGMAESELSDKLKVCNIKVSSPTLVQVGLGLQASCQILNQGRLTCHMQGPCTWDPPTTHGPAWVEETGARMRMHKCAHPAHRVHQNMHSHRHLAALPYGTHMLAHAAS